MQRIQGLSPRLLCTPLLHEVLVPLQTLLPHLPQVGDTFQHGGFRSPIMGHRVDVVAVDELVVPFGVVGSVEYLGDGRRVSVGFGEQL